MCCRRGCMKIIIRIMKIVETQYPRLPHANPTLICGSVQLETQVLRLYDGKDIKILKKTTPMQ